MRQPLAFGPYEQPPQSDRVGGVPQAKNEADTVLVDN